MPYARRKRLEAPGAGEPEPIPQPGRANWMVEAPVYLLVFFTPLAIGTAHLWSAAIMLAVALFGYTALVLHRARRRRSLLLFPMGVALLAASCLTLIQLVPLPPFLVRWLNPGAADLYDFTLAGVGLWGQGNWRALSLDPPGTAEELVSFLAYTLAFLVVVNYFSDRHRARRLLKAVSWSGFFVALLGFFSKLFMAKAIYGIHPVAADTFFFASFVNPNHLAGFLGLCAPIAVGLALSARERQDRALYGFMGAIIGVGVFMSLSRGGMVAFCLGCVFLLVFAATRSARRLKRVVLVQAIAASVLILAGYLAYDTIIKELGTLGETEVLREDIKLRSWKGTLPMMAEHPVVGIGRGAYASVYPRYKTVQIDRTFTHAENQVLQNMVEWGPVFGILFLGAFVLAFLLALSRAKQSFTLAGCLAGVFTVGLHNLVDFSLEVGGVALPFVAVLGVLAASPFSHAGVPRSFETRPRLPSTLALALAPLFFLVGALCVPFASAHSLQRGTGKLLAIEQAEPAEPCQENRTGQAACEMLRYHPADYLAPLVVGKAFLEARPPKLQRAAYWLSRALYLNPSYSVSYRLSGRALFHSGHREQALDQYRLAAEWDRSALTSTVVEVLRLTGDTQAAIRATPKQPEALLQVARILHNLGKDDAATQAAQKALELDSGELATMDLLGELALARGKLDEAAGLARRAIELAPLHEEAYLLQGEVLLRKGLKDEAEKAWLAGLAQVPDSAMLVYQLGELYLSQDRLKEAEAVADRFKAFAPSGDRSQARFMLLIGRIQEARGMFFEARRSYRQASSLAPDTLPYLYRVGLVEERMGNWDEAEQVYQQLLKQRFRSQEMEERIEVIQKARQLEKNEAMWNNWVDRKDEVEER